MKKALLIFLFWNLLFSGEIKEQSELSIKQFYDNDILIHFQRISIPNAIKSDIEQKVRQRFFKDFVYVWKIMDEDSLAGYAVLDNVLGKSMPITFLAILDNNGHIRSSKIIKYREPYGGAVASPSWLEQFNGKSHLSGFEVGEDIDTISGATISVHAVSKGLKKITLLFPFIKNQINGL